jgi:hypothetical protein
MFSIRPKTLNPIDVVTSSGSAEFFLDDDMVPMNGKKGVSMPIIGIIQASRLRMGGHQRDQFLLPSAGDWEGKHYFISLQEIKNHMLTSTSRASFSRSFAKELNLVFLLICTGCNVAGQWEESKIFNFRSEVAFS